MNFFCFPGLSRQPDPRDNHFLGLSRQYNRRDNQFPGLSRQPDRRDSPEITVQTTVVLARLARNIVMAAILAWQTFWGTTSHRLCWRDKPFKAKTYHSSFVDGVTSRASLVGAITASPRTSYDTVQPCHACVVGATDLGNAYSVPSFTMEWSFSLDTFNTKFVRTILCTDIHSACTCNTSMKSRYWVRSSKHCTNVMTIITFMTIT
jgi:hypothetical protein